MSPEFIVTIGFGVFTVVFLMVLILRYIPKKLKAKHFVRKWRDLQRRCSNPEEWPKVLSEADDLLDKALKKKRVKGENMGERLVNAQKLFTDNDAVWFGHKLRTKYDSQAGVKLKKEDMHKALVGLRQGLKDLGAF